jgi:hypothetical protein
MAAQILHYQSITKHFTQLIMPVAVAVPYCFHAYLWGLLLLTLATQTRYLNSAYFGVPVGLCQKIISPH